MPSSRQGAIHLFRLAGIDVFLHWWWFLVAFYEISSRSKQYSSILWNILEYLTLFLIVLVHEFGHALACRQVGGRANQIILWPLGGVAFVDPPPRPGATLWSIVAGPLVNVVLVPVLWLLVILTRDLGWARELPNAYSWLYTIAQVNVVLLAFNILPIYPLDGGQILRSLLWFVLGRARSLFVATILGFVGVIGLGVLALVQQSAWLGVLAVFILMNCWGGLQQARMLLRLAKVPRRAGYSCPTCDSAPPLGNFWTCPNCGQSFDTFETRAICPHCNSRFPVTQCLDCNRGHAIEAWSNPVISHQL